VIGMCKTGTNGGFGICGTAASREWNTEVDSSNGLDDAMMGDDECSVGMQDRAGMGITKWLAQQGKARFGLGRKQATRMHVVAVVVVAVVGGGS
jgi:hypothetical protein